MYDGNGTIDEIKSKNDKLLQISMSTAIVIFICLILLVIFIHKLKLI